MLDLRLRLHHMKEKETNSMYCSSELLGQTVKNGILHAFNSCIIMCYFDTLKSQQSPSQNNKCFREKNRSRILCDHQQKNVIVDTRATPC